MKLLVYLALGLFTGQNAMEAKDSFDQKMYWFFVYDLVCVAFGIVSFFVVWLSK